MARAYGWSARLLFGFEPSYGQSPASSTYHLMPFISSTLDSEQGLIESNVLGLGRDPTTPFQDVINVDGDVVVPVDLRNIGYWLKALLGAPKTTETKPYQHEFISGQTTLPSISLEVGLPDVPDYPLFVGVRVNSMAFNFQRSGEAQVTISMMGQGEISSPKTRDPKPLEAVYSRFSQFQGSIKQSNQLLADVTSASLTYSNNLEKIETIRNDGKVEAIDPGIASLKGSLSVRYGNSTLMDLARAGTPLDLELGYQIDKDRQLQIIAHEVYLPKPKRSINGPGGIEASYDFQGAKDQSLGKMLTIKLTNDVKEYV